MSAPALSIADLSVNEILRRWPSAVAALNAYGLDTCCGGALSLADSAAEAGVPVTALVEAVEKARAGEAGR